MDKGITSERLFLRELTLSDLDVVAELLGNPEAMRYWPRPQTREEAAQWIERHRARYAADGVGYWLALDRWSGLPVGQIGLLRQSFELDGSVRDCVGLGYILHPAFWGRGLATEGARACLRYAFEELGEEAVAVLVRPENEPSLRVAERLGSASILGLGTGFTKFGSFDVDATPSGFVGSGSKPRVAATRGYADGTSPRCRNAPGNAGDPWEGTVEKDPSGVISE